MTEAVWIFVGTPEPRVWGWVRLPDSLTIKAGPEERERKLHTDPLPEPLTWCGSLLRLALPHCCVSILMFVECHKLHLVQPARD